GPASRLTVAADYGQNRREVVLDGEALFDVRHDEARPFSVRAGRALIEDLGTRFTVRSTDSAEVRVAVTDGSVRLQAAGAGEAVVLTAGDRGIVRSDGRAVAEPGRASDADLGWTRGSLVFESASLAEVGTQLRRWYGIELQIADPVLRTRRLTATFRGESVPEVLGVIARALGVEIELRADTAVVQGPAR
ncbi:MAG TPA: FecR domain-containing protein, partial [Longimicrobiales bacterium]|nr:FecR domain-containing protein [Longimicrobiales bacterium]